MLIDPKLLPELDTVQNRLRLATALGVSERTVQRYLKSNSSNLTKSAALDVIKKITKRKEKDIVWIPSVSANN